MAQADEHGKKKEAGRFTFSYKHWAKYDETFWTQFLSGINEKHENIFSFLILMIMLYTTILAVICFEMYEIKYVKDKILMNIIERKFFAALSFT
jgi:hypothetical protein